MRMNRETIIICGNLSHLRNLRAVWGGGAVQRLSLNYTDVVVGQWRISSFSVVKVMSQGLGCISQGLERTSQSLERTSQSLGYTFYR